MMFMHIRNHGDFNMWYFLKQAKFICNLLLKLWLSCRYVIVILSTIFIWRIYTSRQYLRFVLDVKWNEIPNMLERAMANW